jgi:sulfur relay (sulfurtransferase) DsrC/TusE family protein
MADDQDKPLTPNDLKIVEHFADKMFAKFGIDVAFTRHFLDRVNDPRNRKQITVTELIRLFNEAFAKVGPKIDKMKPDQEAVLNDPKTWINVPFCLKLDPRTRQMVMINKTVMRKKDFVPNDPKEQLLKVALDNGDAKNTTITGDPGISVPASDVSYITRAELVALDSMIAGEFHQVPDQLPPSKNRKMRTGPSGDPDMSTSDPDMRID